MLFLLNSLVGIKMVVSLHFFKACHAIFLDAVCFNRLCLLMHFPMAFLFLLNFLILYEI